MSASDTIKTRIVNEFLSPDVLKDAGLVPEDEEFYEEEGMDKPDFSKVSSEKGWKRCNKYVLKPGKETECYLDYDGAIESLQEEKDLQSNGFEAWKMLMDLGPHKHLIYRSYVLQADIGRDAGIEILSTDNEDIIAFRVNSD